MRFLEHLFGPQRSERPAAPGTTAITSLVLTGTSTNELTAGRQGTTNPAFNVDNSAGTSATGVNITAAAAGSRVSVAAISSGTDEGIDIDAKGAGTVRIGNTSTGNVAVGRPLDLSAAAAGQIVFPASQNASAGANTLDDYEEGTWTPTLTFATPGNLNVVYSGRVGSYTKVGRAVCAMANISTSTFTHTTASGALQITGLPFAPAQNDFGAGTQWTGITKASYTDVIVGLGSGSTTASVNICGSGQGVANVSTGDVPSGGTPAIGSRFWYEV